MIKLQRHRVILQATLWKLRLANQHQLSRRQRTTLSAITDTYLGELSSMDSDASPARPQYELLPETSDSDDEGSHGSEDSSA